MKITRMTDRLLTAREVEAMKRFRMYTNDCQFACLSENVMVMLLTDETDPEQLRSMALSQMDEAMGSMPDFVPYNMGDGSLMIGAVGHLFGMGVTRDLHYAITDYVALRNLTLALGEQQEVLAVVTGEGKEAEFDPADVDGPVSPDAYDPDLYPGWEEED